MVWQGHGGEELSALRFRSISQPLVMGDGKKDVHISVEYGKRNFRVLKSEYKQLELIPEADHNTVWLYGGE